MKTTRMTPMALAALTIVLGLALAARLDEVEGLVCGLDRQGPRLLRGLDDDATHLQHHPAIARPTDHGAEIGDDARNAKTLIHELLDKLGPGVVVRRHLAQHLGKRGDAGERGVDLVRQT